MAEKRTGEVSVTRGGGDLDERKQFLKHDIERTRNEIEDTVAALEARLSPARLKEQITSVKEHAVGQLLDAKEHVKSELVRDVQEAKEKVKNEIDEARTAVRDATVGKVEHMVHRTRTQVRDAGSNVAGTIRANPIPAALVGVGLAWLFMSARNQSSARRIDVRRYEGEDYGRNFRGDYGDEYGEVYGGRDDDYQYGREYGRDSGGGRDLKQRVAGAADDIRHKADDVRHKAEDWVEGAREKATGFVHDSRDKASGFVHDARDRADHMMHDARDRAAHVYEASRGQIRRVGGRIENVWDENPLAIGAVAFAVGAAVGLAIPGSEMEDRMFGETKERLLNRAQDMAREAIHQAEDRATGLIHQQRDAQGEQGDKQGQKNEYKNGLADRVDQRLASDTRPGFG